MPDNDALKFIIFFVNLLFLLIIGIKFLLVLYHYRMNEGFKSQCFVYFMFTFIICPKLKYKFHYNYFL